MNKLLFALALSLTTLLGMSGCAVTSGQSSVGQYVDDATITSGVKARFAQDSQVNAMRVKVETLNGVVELSGFSVSETEKIRAAEIARKVAGVREVHNNIIVRPPKIY